MSRRLKEKQVKEGKIGVLICIILLIIMLPILIVSTWILVDSVVHPDDIPSFIGYRPFIVMSGSMEPTLNIGDLEISKETDPSTLKVGDVISYMYKDNVVITHRIIEITSEDGETVFITKGDNNATEDLLPVKFSQVKGKHFFKVNGAGKIAMFIQKPQGFILVASIPILVIIFAQIVNTKIYKKELETLKKKANK